MFKKIKQFIAPKWRPFACRPEDIIAVFRECISINAPMARFIVEYKGARHKLGMDANYERGKWSNIEFYIDGTRYATLEEFCENCTIDGDRFVDVEFISILEDEDSGDPRNNALFEKSGSK